MLSKRKTSSKTISRLSLYRRMLATWQGERVDRIYSHQLARGAGVSAAQVRRDIMGLGYCGTPNNGYDVRGLIDNIAAHIDAPTGQQVALIGIGNLGKAILSHFSRGSKTRLKVAAAFDVTPEKTERVLYGCRCYRIEQLSEVVQREQISVGIVAVPPEAAQATVDRLAANGITGILNFAPVAVKAPPLVYIENVDITIKLETVAFFAQQSNR